MRAGDPGDAIEDGLGLGQAGDLIDQHADVAARFLGFKHLDQGVGIGERGGIWRDDH